MVTKLTLSMDKKVIEDAKNHLSNYSLSQLVENYFRILVAAKKSKLKNPILSEITGIAKLPHNKTPEDVVVEHLLDKHK